MKRKHAHEYLEDLVNLMYRLDGLWFSKSTNSDLSSLLSCLDEVIDTARNMKIQIQREK